MNGAVRAMKLCFCLSALAAGSSPLCSQSIQDSLACELEEDSLGLVQLAIHLPSVADPQQLPIAPSVFQAKIRSENASALHWHQLRRFEPRVSQGKNLDAKCSNIGRRYPVLVSRSEQILDAYREYACNTAPRYLVTDPEVALAAEMTQMDGGCINMQLWPKVIFATNGTHAENLYRRCTGTCQPQQLPAQLVDSDVLVLSSLRAPPGMEYQHGLTDFFPEAWTVRDLLLKTNSSLKLLVHSPVHVEMMASIGVSAEHLLQIPLKDQEEALLCVPPGRALHLWRTARAEGGPLPTLDYDDSRKYADFWFRLLSYQVGPELSDGIAKHMLWASDASPGANVVFMQRCSSSRQLNEAAGLAATSTVLADSNLTAELLSFCPGHASFLQQVQQVRKARLIISEHGGALANMIFARRGTGVIELVGSPAANAQLGGEFPPYKSMWYGGAGAAFSFYRVVLYETDAQGRLKIRLDDLQEAVKQWLQTRPADI
ncbi:unnamed protein product [Effrenium voratum]|nr:unnamed protein product [Effrenium voratum]|mmetsp:Transcript_45253/g.107539  ORF Transcript_45253/g.107539 Transcript_45253/m.107539 type:complete len:487 (+) Transcript_45253:48-1508(+)